MNTALKLLIAAACLLLATPVLAAPYTLSPDGTEVTDSKTGLTWRRCSEGQAWSGTTCTGTALAYTHEQALARAQTQTGWRLPDVKELASLADRSPGNPAIDPTVFPGAVSSWYWSSSPFAGISSSAWVVNFANGLVSYYSRSLYQSYVRLVR